MTTSEGRSPTRALPSWSFWLKVGLVALLDALTVAAVPVLAANGSWALLVILILSVALINWAYLSPRARVARWLIPSLIPLVLFVVWPIIYTSFVSLTNWATGNVLTKEQVVSSLESQVIRSESGGRLELTVLEGPDGEIAYYLQDEDGTVFFGVPRPRSEPPVTDALLDPETLGVVDTNDDGQPESVGDFEAVTGLGLTRVVASGVLDANVLDLPTGVAEVQTTTSARLVEAANRYSYDPSTDTLTDAQTGTICVVEGGNFVCDGVRLDPGWRIVIGFDNYTAIFTNPDIRDPFIQVFLWTVVFAGLSVFLTFAIGLLLANTLQDRRVGGRAFYRSMYIIPYAIPAFLSALVWRGLLNNQYGQVNEMLAAVGIGAVPWLLDGTWAKVAVLLVNTWLGFPYMFLITTGALQSVPTEFLEAARVDGAGPIHTFRTVTLPLLLVSTAPLLIGSFAFNFNNFVLIYLLTQGGPPVAGADVPYGQTDILISFTFDLAVRSGRGANFALASAIVIIIFFLVALMAALSFRFTKRLEDIYG